MAALPARGTEPASGTRQRGALDRLRRHSSVAGVLLRERRFWAAIALSSALAGSYDVVEAFAPLPEVRALAALPHEFLRDGLLIIPVIYAGVRLGMRGALAIAFWCTLITIPNWIFLHEGSERAGTMSQMAIVYAVAVFVGSRSMSEAKYRAIFHSAGEGVLVVREGGEVVEANAAARALLGWTRPTLEHLRLPATLSSALDTARAGSAPPDAVRLEGAGEEDVWLEPVCTPLPGGEGLTQVVLRNVTQQRRRQSRLQSYAARVLHAQEEERQRIAQELHDDTVQSLVLLCRRIDAVEDAPVRETPAQMRRLRDDVEATIASLRDYLRGLRPAVLDDLGLEPAIRSLVEEAGERTDTDVSFAVEGAVRRLEQTAELALFRIAQEALRNMARHSRAAHGRVILLYLDDEVVLAVTDDGIGFRPPGTRFDQVEAGQLGLLGMQERARIVGGSLQIESRRGTGTTVVATVPQAASRSSSPSRATRSSS